MANLQRSNIAKRLLAQASDDNIVLVDDMNKIGQTITVGSKRTSADHTQRAVLFPVVVNEWNSTGFKILGVEVYAAVLGDFSRMIDKDVPRSFLNCHGRIVQNYYEKGADLHECPEEGVTFLRVRGITRNSSGDVLHIDGHSVPVSGTSLNLAMAVLNRTKFDKLCPIAFTGDFNDNDEVEHNHWASLKHAACAALNIPLMGNGQCDINVQTVTQAVEKAKNVMRGLDTGIHRWDIMDVKVPALQGDKFLAATEGDEWDFPPPPPVTSDVEDAQNAADALVEGVRLGDTRMMKLLDVLGWISTNDVSGNGSLLDNLHRFSQLDPEAMRFHNILNNSTPVKAKGVTASVNQNMKAKKVQAMLATQGLKVPIDWIVRNGNRGPSADQMAIMRSGRLPEIMAPENKLSGEDLSNLVRNVLLSNLGEAYLGNEAARSDVEAIVRENGGRGPREEQVKALVLKHNPAKGKAPPKQQPAFTQKREVVDLTDGSEEIEVVTQPPNPAAAPRPSTSQAIRGLSSKFSRLRTTLQ